MIDNSKYANLLKSSFLHFKSIGRKTENDLWEKGIKSWDDLESYIRGNQLNLFNDYKSRNSILDEINSSRQALEREDVDYFANKLPKNEYFRIVLTFFEKTIFLDIETTGLSKYYDYITVIGCNIGGKYNYYIKGDDYTLLKKSLEEAKCLVTFNGSIFDIPFLKKEFKDIILPKTHVDLIFFSRRAGLTGGQKKIENDININRPKDIKEIDGKGATILWYKYRRGDIKSIKSLIGYNYFDIIGMEIIYDEIINRLYKNNHYPIYDKPIFQFRKDKNIPVFNLSFSEFDLNKKRLFLESSIKSFTFRDLIYKNKKIDFSVIGIDLTGSEDRASGCCLLKGNVAYTELIKTDKELITYILNNKPNLISIDSPLSLPEGRISTNDDDPGRYKFGIMRFCERELKRRGVNVYPCLIPSMQKLTERGIKLANNIRTFGFPVIESYPGAAQDILKIPRKRTDLEMLRLGLIEFGIKGEFQNKIISHDELDAITSALVGYFFWFGNFEALGNFEEENLIIPDINIPNSIWGNRIIIGISGPLATGKTTAGKFIELKGYYYTRFSIFLEKMLRENGIKVNRENLQELGFKIKNEGQRTLCKNLYKDLPTHSNIVIDGIRHPEDHAFLVEFFGPNFRHIYIDSLLKNRRHRYINGGRTKKEFDNAIKHKVEQNISKLPDIAHIKINNNESIKQFELTIDNTLKQIIK